VCKTVTRSVQNSAVTIRITTAFAGIIKIVIGWGGEREIAYCPKIFMNTGMEMKEMYFKKRPERLKSFHQLQVYAKYSLIAMHDC